MDYDKRIERLRKEAYGSDIEDLLLDAATDIETLRAENERLRDVIQPNCIGCHHIHPDNGNCTAVGGFFTAVPAAHCPLIPELRADLARVTAERDAAIADIAAILAEVEEIRRGYGVDNADADNAFADLCGNYCAKNGNVCYKEAEDYRCKNFMWRGMKED